MKPLIVTSLLLLSSFTLAQDHGSMNMPSMTGMQMMQMPGMDKMMALTGKDFNRAFLSMMIPHHQGAIDMAEMELKMGKDAKVKQWARKIIQDQKKEIAEMQKLLTSQGGMDEDMAAQMKNMMNMPDMNGMDPDKIFVQMMIPHHASAIHMAGMALEKSGNFEVLRLARNIVSAQGKEIYDFKVWLSKH